MGFTIAEVKKRKPAAKAASAKKASPARKSESAAAEPVKEVKRVPPRIVRKPGAAQKSDKDQEVADNSEAVALAMQIAQRMKRSAQNEDKIRLESEIKLSRRPTTRTQGKTTVKFPVSDLKEFKKRLLEARAQATSGVDVLKSTGFNETDDHEADGGDGTNQTLRLQALGQMGSINRTIQQIDEALHRIDDGTYGVCTSCGQLIRKPRLLNQPFVLTCMECQSEMERGAK